ncbi:hypothetical protein GDO86_015155 [Hymenochirus boettgeri]|uniref:AKNA domain-containing protein n=1 Tax=Hymenochirus boettgeri TaxID=247094 RepID=A0A8T2JUC2_9PIPI|nr:hypothetical protein GDO86_015155 [Hymenochirus boettgeri]
MNVNKRHNEREISGDEENSFAQYMDENGVIGMEEQNLLQMEEERIMELDEELVLGFQNQLVSYPEPLSEEELSGALSLDGKFIFSQTAEDQDDGLQDTGALEDDDDVNEMLDTDGRSSEGHPDASLSLPTDWHPLSRDLQLDMTEDEQDHGSSIERWDDEEEKFGQEQYDLPNEKSLFPEMFEGYNHSLSSPKDLSTKNLNHQEDEPSVLTVSPSPHPISGHWAPRLISDLGELKISPGIEDETLPESSRTDSCEASLDPPSKNHQKPNITQAKARRPEPTPKQSAPSTMVKTQSFNMKPNKSNAAPLYGRGQLNYPIPDISKVGPRVRFPRDDQCYQPPQSKRLDSKTPKSHSIFKSPAEIVREVLLSSSEKPTEEQIARPIVPKEFQSPQQATDLVHQLQEDYHKLLTKYAEAENTIDRLRLGAKVNLYSDPPIPSHSVHMGTLLQSSKPLEFAIPQLQRATISFTSESDGASGTGAGSQTPQIHVEDPSNIPSSTASSSSPLRELASTLSSYLNELKQEVELLEELLNAGKLNPEEQQQAMWELRGSLDMLERRYLRAREDHPKGMSEELDPERALEGAIYQLGLYLDNLQDRKGGQEDESNMDGLLSLSPMPSYAAPVPALITPYPQQVSQLEELNGPASISLDIGNKEEAEMGLPQPLRHKQIQVEKEYDTLISTYSSFKTLPDALGLDQDEWPKTHPQHSIFQEDIQLQQQQQDARSQGYSIDTQLLNQDTQSESHQFECKNRDIAHTTKPHKQPRFARHKISQQFVGPQDYPQNSEVKAPLPTSRYKKHPQPTRLVNQQKEVRPSGSPVQTQCLPEPRRMSHDHQDFPSPGNQRHLANKRVHQKTVPTRRSQNSSALSYLMEESPRDPHLQPTINGENTPGDHSYRSSNSVSSSTQEKKPRGEQPRDKAINVQARILSPETDSGFLGSETGRSPQLQKQRDLHGEIPLEIPVSCVSSPVRSRTESDRVSRTSKAFWEKRQQSNRWTGPSQTSSPSPGPNSLTETESRDNSQISESDSEKDRCADVVISDPYFGGSFLRPPITKQPNQNLLETRTARDQAINDLQKEVVQLRKHLENTLNCTQTSEKSTQVQSPSALNPQNERISHYFPAWVSSLSDKRATIEEPSPEPLQRNSAMTTKPNQRSAHTEKKVCGAYTGTTYCVPDVNCHLPIKQATNSTPKHFHGVRRSTPVPVIQTDEEDTSPTEQNPCPLCHSSCDSADTQQRGTAKCQKGKHKRRSLKAPQGGQWVFNQNPPLKYMQNPYISYSTPVIPSPYLILPVGYSITADVPSQHNVTPEGALTLEDLTLPLDRALEAAKKLKITSKRMCRSLTCDLSVQHRLRGSCLF